MSEVTIADIDNLGQDPNQPAKRSRLRSALVASSILLPAAAAGFFVGWKVGDYLQHDQKVADIREANGYERCLAIEISMQNTGRIILNASQISPRIQEDCGVKKSVDNAKKRLAGVVYSSHEDNQLDGGIEVDHDPTVFLPSVDAVENEIDALHQDASQTTAIPLIFANIGALAALSTAAVPFAIRYSRRSGSNQAQQAQAAA